ncbi:class I SAM-dependent methyltransferase [Chryseobacterium sediminis]|uniref:class I SAM-dependent methyltransferase n=1 Tax=Chryseobacterium sediminis TaxID=1679494 RepID=UPI002858BBAF|nr:class I SAM-dependent methyltransferase [Chryseobacterium sediminis]MDR6462680.1 SAM-dependent methyltransferase [Chryseobacterium sediminis]
MKLKKITIQSYNQTATEYRATITSFDILPELEMFTRLIFKNGRILDLGCGPGNHSKYFFDLGFDVTGIDLSKQMINIARKEFSKIDFQVMDIENLAFVDNSFDGIWASASLIHIEKRKFSKVLHKLQKLLKDTGVLYISLKLGVGEELIKDSRYFGVSKFYSYFQYEEIERFLNNCKFEIFDFHIIDKRTIYDTNNWIHLFIKKTNDN